MITAVVGSRGLSVEDMGKYIPRDTTEIVSGGAAGIDRCAEKYAAVHGIPLKVFLPRYDLYGRAAPVRRNEQIVMYADRVVAIWDGSSRGTGWVIAMCKKHSVPVHIYIIEENRDL